MGIVNDLTGKRFGKLVVIKRADDYVQPSGKHRIRWLCKCDCGNIKVINGKDMVKGETKSCGCLHREKVSTHNLSKNLLYDVLHRMYKCCCNPNCNNYENYGGRGIKLVSQWNKDIVGMENAVKNFIQWSKSHGYKKGLSIDRKNNDGNYESSNCRWVSRKIQNNNKRSNIFITYMGEKHTIKEWSEIKNISYNSLRERLITLHWKPEKAFNTPTRKQHHYKINIEGEDLTLKEIALKYNIPRATLDYRLKNGWTISKTILTPVDITKRGHTYGINNKENSKCR
jgi:hypothetical protein